MEISAKGYFRPKVRNGAEICVSQKPNIILESHKAPSPIIDVLEIVSTKDK